MADTKHEISVLDDDAPATYPMVPIRDVVVFPSMMVPFVIGRASSVVALEMALRRDKKIYLATQKDASQGQSFSRGHLQRGHGCQHRTEPQTP